MEDKQKRVLSSWKEVASYLGVSVRTAQMWEADRGLPVNRLPGRRGLIWADKTDLDNWRKSGGNHWETSKGLETRREDMPPPSHSQPASSVGGPLPSPGELLHGF